MTTRPHPPPPWEPHGRALADHWAGRTDRPLEVHCDDAPVEQLSAAVFFRPPEVFEPWERTLLAACRGRVLDVGAGGGAHALWLQDQGHVVCALDVDAACVAVQRARGVVDARVGTLADIDDGPFDTVLFAMHGIGIAGDLVGLAWLLAEAWRLLAPDGCVLLDSRAPLDAEGVALTTAADPDDDYPGVCELWMRYDGASGSRFRWLFVDEHTLAAVAGLVGLSTEVLAREPDLVDDHVAEPGRYLARLSRA